MSSKQSPHTTSKPQASTPKRSQAANGTSKKSHGTSEGTPSKPASVKDASHSRSEPSNDNKHAASGNNNTVARQSRPHDQAPGNTPSKPRSPSAQRLDAQRARLDQERRQQSSAAASKALKLQKEAHNLTQAALATADADERQKLLSEALNKLVEAGALGKVAKYLTTGTCQGMLAGGGLGVGIGVGLGTLVGVLVGGVTGLVLGGLGTGLGAVVGALHGPWFKPGEVVASGIGKVTGAFLPDWEATPEQKYQLEKMIGQANEMDRPTDEELQAMTAGDGEGWLSNVERGQGPEWTRDATWVPGKSYVTNWWQGKGKKDDKDDKKGQGLPQLSVRNDLKAASPAMGKVSPPAGQQGAATGPPESKSNGQSTGQSTGSHVHGTTPPAKRKPAKLEVRSQKGTAGTKQKSTT